MDLQIKEITEDQATDVDDRLMEYYEKYSGECPEGDIRFGLFDQDRLIGGVLASVADFAICYVNTVYVDPEYRRSGCGRHLVSELEERARNIGANIVHLSYFDFENANGADFYRRLGYEEVGGYKTDQYSEHFFIKRL